MKELKIIFFSLISLISTVVFPQATTLSLNQLLDSAVQHNYLIQSNEKNRLIKQSEIDILRNEYLPVVGASASFSVWKFLLPNKQKLLGDALTDMYTDITISQTIYDWGENKMRRAVVEEEIKLNDELLRQIKNTIVLGVADTYFEALKAGSEIETHINSLKQLHEQLKYSENLYQIGKVSTVDVLKINVQIAQEEKNLAKSESALMAQQIKLKRQCFINDETDFQIEQIGQSLFNNLKNQIINIPALYDSTLRNHPALLYSDGEIALETKQKEVYRLQNRPYAYSYGIATWEDGYIPYFNNFNFNIGAGIRYTIPYWGGSSFKSKMLQSDFRMEQISDRKNQAFIDIKKEIDVTLNTLDDLKTEVGNHEKIIGLAQETLINAELKYQSGQGTIIDVLDAQSILTESNIALSKSELEFLQALARLHYLTGNDNYPF